MWLVIFFSEVCLTEIDKYWNVHMFISKHLRQGIYFLNPRLYFIIVKWWFQYFHA